MSPYILRLSDATGNIVQEWTFKDSDEVNNLDVGTHVVDAVQNVEIAEEEG
jgi:hypothetical protein